MSAAMPQTQPEPLAEQRIVSLLGHELLLITGKGGVGKSTVAAVLARQAASRGLRVCLIEMEAVSRAAPLFGAKTPTAEPVEVAKDLSLACLNAMESLRFFATQQLKVPALVSLALKNKAVESFFSGHAGRGAHAAAVPPVAVGGRLWPAWQQAF